MHSEFCCLTWSVALCQRASPVLRIPASLAGEGLDFTGKAIIPLVQAKALPVAAIVTIVRVALPCAALEAPRWGLVDLHTVGDVPASAAGPPHSLVRIET